MKVISKAEAERLLEAGTHRLHLDRISMQYSVVSTSGSSFGREYFRVYYTTGLSLREKLVRLPYSGQIEKFSKDGK